MYKIIFIKYIVLINITVMYINAKCAHFNSIHSFDS